MPVTPKAEQVVQAWRERGPDEEPKPTGRARYWWMKDGERVETAWVDWPLHPPEPPQYIEYEFVSRTPGKTIPEDRTRKGRA